MPVDAEPIIDAGELRDHIRAMYRDVAEQPDGDFHFELGRAVAERLGYPAEWLDAVPPEALASFAGVGHMLDLAAIEPGDTVLDLGLGLGHRRLRRRAPHGTVGPCDRCRHDRRPAGQGPPPARRPRPRPRGLRRGPHRGAPGRPGHRRRRHLQRRREPGARQGRRRSARRRGRCARAAAWPSPTSSAPASSSSAPAATWRCGRPASPAPCRGRTTSARSRWRACSVQIVRENAYRFLSPRAQAAADKYGVTSVTVLATKPQEAQRSS